MASNPMQRKTRNSFLLGMVVTLIFAGAIIAFLFMQMKKVKEENLKNKQANTTVYVLTQDVNSGDVITSDMFIQAKANIESIPADYIDVNTLISAYSLYTKDGVRITSEYGKDEKNPSNKAQHLYLNGDKNSEVFKDETGGFYLLKNGNKEYIETKEAPVVAKVAMKAKTIVSPSMIARSNDIATDDVREQEYNMLVLPTDLEDKNYIDVRLMLPTGQDYIVISKKQITIPTNAGEYLTDTIHMNLSEDEILTMSNAIVEAYRMNGSKLYVTKYTEPGIQNAATPTYVTSQAVRNLMATDPNIVDKAKAALVERYSQASVQRRNEGIEPLLQDPSGDDAVKSKMEESITSTQESRKEYLQSLTAPATAGTTSTTK